jgi:predicted RNA binding protein YcfA (HicA-like mRNA interferase family)
LLRDSRDIIARLRREGFEPMSVRGSHHKFGHPKLRRMVIVPPAQGLAARNGSIDLQTGRLGKGLNTDAALHRAHS